MPVGAKELEEAAVNTPARVPKSYPTVVGVTQSVSVQPETAYAEPACEQLAYVTVVPVYPSDESHVTPAGSAKLVFVMTPPVTLSKLYPTVLAMPVLIDVESNVL
jgi:hypothetical protein